MSERLWVETQNERGLEIDDDWLRAYIDKLDALPVFDGFGYQISVMMTHDLELQQEICDRGNKAAKEKPMACCLCSEKEATVYHILAGRVCPECQAECYKTEDRLNGVPA